MEKKGIAESKISMGHLMQPQQANVAGNVHGGEIMKLMDNTAGIVAKKHSRKNVVTARVDELQFIKAIHIGDYVSFIGTMTYVGNSSMEVLVEVFVESLNIEDKKKLALKGYFTMVALGEDHRPTKVPGLKIESESEKKNYEEGKMRYKKHKKSP